MKGEVLQDIYIELIDSPKQPSTTPSQENALGRDGENINNHVPVVDKGKQLALEEFHTPRSLSNAIKGGTNQFQNL
jgi:hypothetical protein